MLKGADCLNQDFRGWWILRTRECSSKAQQKPKETRLRSE